MEIWKLWHVYFQTRLTIVCIVQACLLGLLRFQFNPPGLPSLRRGFRDGHFGSRRMYMLIKREQYNAWNFVCLILECKNHSYLCFWRTFQSIHQRYKCLSVVPNIFRSALADSSKRSVKTVKGRDKLKAPEKRIHAEDTHQRDITVSPVRC